MIISFVLIRRLPLIIKATRSWSSSTSYDCALSSTGTQLCSSIMLGFITHPKMRSPLLVLMLLRNPIGLARLFIHLSLIGGIIIQGGAGPYPEVMSFQIAFHMFVFCCHCIRCCVCIAWVHELVIVFGGGLQLVVVGDHHV